MAEYERGNVSAMGYWSEIKSWLTCLFSGLLVLNGLVSCESESDREDTSRVPIDVIEKLNPAHRTIVVRPSNSILVSYELTTSFQTLYFYRECYQWDGRFFNSVAVDPLRILEIETEACRITYDRMELLLDEIEMKDEGVSSEVQYAEFYNDTEIGELHWTGNTLRITDCESVYSNRYLFDWDDATFTFREGDWSWYNVQNLRTGEFCCF